MHLAHLCWVVYTNGGLCCSSSHLLPLHCPTPLSLCLLGQFPNTWFPPHACFCLPLLPLSSVSFLQQGAQELWVTEEAASAPFGVCFLWPCSRAGPGVQPALITQRQLTGLSSTLNLIQEGAAVPCLLGMIGLDVCFRDMKWIMRIYHDKWYVCHCKSGDLFFTLETTCGFQ